MAGDGNLAQVSTAKGYQVGQYLVLLIAGEKPSPCHEVDIEVLPIDIFPPQFRAALTTDPLAICAQVITPYERVEAFPFSNLAGKSVAIETEGGTIEVTVEAVETDATAAAAAPGASTADIVGPPAIAFGYSDDYDFGAALKDAIDKLPPRGGGIPDWLAQYRVLEVGAEIGGIAGFDRLYVKIAG